MDILTLNLTESVIKSPHFNAEDKSRIKGLVYACSEKEEELMLFRDCFKNMSIQYFKSGVSEDNRRWLKGEITRISYETGKLSSNIINMYVCGMGSVFERLEKI